LGGEQAESGIRAADAKRTFWHGGDLEKDSALG